MKTIPYFIFFVLLSMVRPGHLLGQEISPLQVFTPKETNMGNQNWMISQGEDQTIYFANNQGLASYNAAQWQLYPAKDNSITRSVKVIDGRIYSSSYMDFGYWEKDQTGQLRFTSLCEKLQIVALEDEQIWNILSLENHIIFQSLNRLIIVHKVNEKVTYFSSENTLLKSFKIEDKIYFQVQDEGLYTLEEGQAVLVGSSALFKEENIVNLFKDNMGIIALTQDSGFYRWQKNQWMTWGKPNQKIMGKYSIYSAIRLSNSDYALGTVGKGLLLFSSEGELLEEINQERGLSNNTVLSLFEDTSSNLWLGLDNGINLINRSSRFKEFIDVKGQLGSVYASAVDGDYFYVGTNQGLFVRNKNKNEPFELIENTQGQVWKLSMINNQLFCGHHRGAMLINEKKATLVSNEKGTWLFRQHPNRHDLLFLGNYTGLYVIEKKRGKWSFRNKINGFDISSRFFEFASTNKIVVNHEYKGVYIITLDDLFYTAENVQLDEVSCKSCNSSLVKFKGDIIYHYRDKFYAYDPFENNFTDDSLKLPNFLTNGVIKGKLINDDTGRLWNFTKKNLYYIENEKLTNTTQIKSFSLNENDRKNVSGFEHINAIDRNNYLIGTNRGYLTIDLAKSVKEKSSVAISTILANNKDQVIRLDLRAENNLPFEYNNIDFYFTNHDFSRYGKTSFQYRLEGEDSKWSNWTEQRSVNYSNLSYGKYRFKLRTKTGDIVNDLVQMPLLTIAPPWYLKRLAIFGYTIIFIFLLVLYNSIYKRKMERQKIALEIENQRKLELQELEAQKEIIKLRNEQLQNDIDGKSRELAIATMSTLKRNEFLNSIKEELGAIKEVPKIKQMIKSINSKLKNNDDWEYFRKAFDNSDQSLFRKLKTAHPELTKNDLKLCAYLRLNLSSKEIAPLLNISVHSVEIKRYRLRKKMGLIRKQGVVEYIMEF